MSREEVDDFAIRTAMELESLKRQIYGAKSERHLPPEIAGQMKLELGEIGQAEDPPGTETISYKRKKPKKRKPHPGRYALPADLPRKEIIIEPEEDTSGMIRIGEEITEALDYIPPKFFVNRYIRPKYALAGGEGVLTAPMPSRPIEKGIAEAALLALCTTPLKWASVASWLEQEKPSAYQKTVSEWEPAMALSWRTSKGNFRAPFLLTHPDFLVHSGLAGSTLLNHFI